MIGRPSGLSELPPKLFFRIGEVAGLVGVEPHVLRYWEREFRSIRPTKSAKGQRVYSRKDVENLLRVRDLLYRDGFTIAGAKKKLQRPDDPDGLPPDATVMSTATSAEDPTAEPEAPAASGQLEVAVETVALVSSVSAPMAPVSRVVRPDVREKLVALRDEVEEFLAELSSHRR